MSLRAALLCSLLAVVAARSVARARTSTPGPSLSDGWRRYIEDESLTGRNIPCSGAEKECFKLDRVLYPGDGKCYIVGQQNPCPDGLTFQIDKREAMSGSSRFKGACVNKTMCPGWKIKMSADGSCVTFEELLEICSHQRGYGSNQDVFGEYECMLINKTRAPIHIQQPRHNGRCLFPDVREATFPKYVEERIPDRIPCSGEDVGCLRSNKVYYERDRRCYELLRQGPCARGQWLVIDKAEAVNGSHRLRAVCVPLPCPRGQALVEGVCRTRSYMVRRVCAGHPLAFNLFGEAGCGPRQARGLPTPSSDSGQCQWVGDFTPFFSVVNIGGAECSESDSGICSPDVGVTHDSPGLD